MESQSCATVLNGSLRKGCTTRKISGKWTILHENSTAILFSSKLLGYATATLLIMKLLKNRPTHILYEHLPGQPLILSPIVFLLAIFLARGAFKSYSDIQQILDVKPPSDQGYWVLDWADHVKDLPVFPTMTAKGMTQKIQTAGAFANQIRGLSIRAGMERPVTPHGIRRECLIQATSKNFGF